MKYLFQGIICLIAAGLIVEAGNYAYENYKARKIMISFFKEYKEYFSQLIPHEIISLEEFDVFKNKVIELAIDELPAKDILLASRFFNNESKEKELNEFSTLLLKAEIIYIPLRFQTHPLERINQ